MLTKDQINVHLAAILTTLADVGGQSPRTPIYLAMGMDIDAYTLVESVLCRAGLAIATNETLSLTDAGKAMASKIESHLTERKRQRAECAGCGASTTVGNCPNCDRPI